MKKGLMILLMAVLACMSAGAQVKFGAKAGLDVTNFWGKHTDHDIRLNYQAGLLMEYQFRPRLAVAPEVVFAAQGGINKGYSGNNYIFHTNYINIPVMLKYYTAPVFSIDFGPQVGFNVYSKYTHSGKVTDAKGWTNTVDFGLGMGFTGQMVGNTFIQMRYTLGLTRVFKSDDEVMEQRKNGNIQLAFGVKF